MIAIQYSIVFKKEECQVKMTQSQERNRYKSAIADSKLLRKRSSRDDDAMNQPIKSSPGRPRSAQADQAILHATLDLLAEVGYQSMSIEAIAARAGVGKATIYRRYTSKEELVADALGSIQEDIPTPDTGSLAQDIDILIEKATQTMHSPLGRQTLALIISTASSSPQFAQVYRKKYMIPRCRAYTTVLERAKTRGEIQKDVDVDLVHELMSGLVFHVLVFQPETKSVEAHIRRAMALLLGGIGV